MVLIPGTAGNFCIDQYESSTMRLIPTGGEEPWPFDRPVDGQTVRAVVRPSAKPQAYISGVQAADACKRSGKRLCTEPEWLTACQGRARSTYPYGNSYVKGACNEGRATNPVNDCFGSGSGVFTYSNMNSPCCVQQPNTVAVGGYLPKMSERVRGL
jgi:sulfatase modifying factor 1